MANDDFTEAARAEAERHVPAFTSNDYTPNGLTAVARLAHVEGWKAARTHLAAQEPTTADAEVEAACVGFYNDPNSLTDWTKLARVQPDLADKYRAGMRRALSAARAARRDEADR